MLTPSFANTGRAVVRGLCYVGSAFGTQFLAALSQQGRITPTVWVSASVQGLVALGSFLDTSGHSPSPAAQP